MRNLFFSLLSVCFAAPAHSQKYYDLSTKPMTYMEDDSKQEGLSFLQKEEVKVRAIGSDDTLVLKNLKFSNSGFMEAKLTFSLGICGFPKDGLSVPGAYFVTIAFFDANKNCLLSSSFVTDGGFALAGIPKNEHSNPPLVRKNSTIDCFDFFGDTKITIHQAFLYSDKQTAGGIKPIKSFTITIFHLGAG